MVTSETQVVRKRGSWACRYFGDMRQFVGIDLASCRPPESEHLHADPKGSVRNAGLEALRARVASEAD